jgi:hypothetical protein
MLKFTRRLTLILVAVLAMGASGGWERLGRLDVGLPADHDVLSVPRKVGPIRELMLEARGDSVEIRDMIVTYDDGNTYKPEFPARVSERSKGEVVKLEGKRRRIRQIDFTYAPAHKKERVQLIVSGR